MVFIFINDLFPTTLRSLILGYCFTFESLASISSGLLNTTLDSAKWVPGVAFGTITIVASLIAIKLPDSNDVPVLMGIDDAKRFYKQIKF